MCKRNGESVDHFLLHCDEASAIWSAFFNCFGLSGLCLDMFICMTISGPLAGQRV